MDTNKDKELNGALAVALSVSVSDFDVLMKRVVESEWLDELPQSDPRAIHSRRDLRRLNFFMGNVGIIERLLQDSFPNHPPKQIVELGAGDGALMLKIAERFSNRWKNLEVVLVDRQNLVSPQTKEEFHQLGWQVQIVSSDVFEWLSKCERCDCMLANLFLHHFEDGGLAKLFRLASGKTKVFLSCEPRRFSGGIFGTKLLRMIGCNDVTRHDAAVSVRAGFRSDELTELWPQKEYWRVDERRSGLFSHSFAAASDEHVDSVEKISNNGS